MLRYKKAVLQTVTLLIFFFNGLVLSGLASDTIDILRNVSQLSEEKFKYLIFFSSENDNLEGFIKIPEVFNTFTDNNVKIRSNLLMLNSRAKFEESFTNVMNQKLKNLNKGEVLLNDRIFEELNLEIGDNLILDTGYESVNLIVKDKIDFFDNYDYRKFKLFSYTTIFIGYDEYLDGLSGSSFATFSQEPIDYHLNLYQISDFYNKNSIISDYTLGFAENISIVTFLLLGSYITTYFIIFLIQKPFNLKLIKNGATLYQINKNNLFKTMISSFYLSVVSFILYYFLGGKSYLYNISVLFYLFALAVATIIIYNILTFFYYRWRYKLWTN